MPEEILADEWRAALATLAVPALLQRARAAYDGQLMVMKGPEVALRYPDPVLRAYRDIDLLADDAEAAERALLAAGFQAMGSAEVDDVGYHVCPLVWPGLPLCIELHRWPHWVEGLKPPPVRELFDAAEPSRLGVAGILAPAPHHHALLLAGHAWVHEPLRRLVELIDVAAVTDGTDREAVRTLARRWGCERVWHTTELAVDSLLYGAAPPLALRTWARHLHGARERTVLESRVQRLAGPAWGLPMREVPRAVLARAPCMFVGTTASGGGRSSSARAGSSATLRARYQSTAASSLRRRRDRMTRLTLRTDDLTWREIDDEIVALEVAVRCTWPPTARNALTAGILARGVGGLPTRRSPRWLRPPGGSHHRADAGGLLAAQGRRRVPWAPLLQRCVRRRTLRAMPSSAATVPL